MRDERRDNSEGSTTIQSPLPVLLRSLYLHGVEYCALAGADRCDVYTKDQIVSLLERGDTDRTVCEAIAQLEPGAFACGRHEGALDSATRVLLVTSTGSEVVAASSIPEGKRPKSRKTLAKKAVPASPPWWNAPIPLAMCTEKGILLNSSGGGCWLDSPSPGSARGSVVGRVHPRSSGSRQDRRVKRQTVLVRAHGRDGLPRTGRDRGPSERRRDGVAGLRGPAFISHFKCRGRPVRQVSPRSARPTATPRIAWRASGRGAARLRVPRRMSLEE